MVFDFRQDWRQQALLFDRVLKTTNEVIMEYVTGSVSGFYDLRSQGKLALAEPVARIFNRLLMACEWGLTNQYRINFDL